MLPHARIRVDQHLLKKRRSQRVKALNDSEGLHASGGGGAISRDGKNASKLRFIIPLQDFAMSQIAEWAVWGREQLSKVSRPHCTDVSNRAQR